MVTRVCCCLAGGKQSPRSHAEDGDATDSLAASLAGGPVSADPPFSRPCSQEGAAILGQCMVPGQADLATRPKASKLRIRPDQIQIHQGLAAIQASLGAALGGNSGEFFSKTVSDHETAERLL